jgi:hypothetical protein
MSSGDSSGNSCSITASTGAPACTMISTLRGRDSRATKACRLSVATSALPGCWATKACVTLAVRL